MNNFKRSISVTIAFLLLSCFSLWALAATVTGVVDYAVLYRLDVGVSGEVKSVSVKEGNRVIEGTLMLQLDDTVLAAEMAAAMAQKNYLLAEMEEHQRAHERDGELYAEGSLSLVELDRSNIKLLESTASFHRSEAEIARRNSRLNLSRITAPVSGLVLRRNSNPGERIEIQNRSEPAFIFTDENKVIRVSIDFDSTSVPLLGAPVEITYSDRTARGKVEAIDTMTDQGRLRLTITTTHSLPDVGSTVSVSY